MKKMLEVLKPILTAAVVAFLAYGFLHYVSFNLRFGVPDLMKLQELAVKELSAPSGVRQSWCQVGDNYWCQVGDGYAYDYFNLINFDRTAGTITVSRMDVVHSHIRHVADYMIFICFVVAGGILSGQKPHRIPREENRDVVEVVADLLSRGHIFDQIGITVHRERLWFVLCDGARFQRGDLGRHHLRSLRRQCNGGQYADCHGKGQRQGQ